MIQSKAPWSERRPKGRKHHGPPRKGGTPYKDGINVYGKRCECDRPTVVGGECWKCGREPKDAPFRA